MATAGPAWHASRVLFLIQCFDGASGGTLRPGARPDHLAYLESRGAQLKLAGPLLGDEGPIGSVFILEAEHLAAANAFADADPYLAAGVFERREVTPMRVSLGAWAG